MQVNIALLTVTDTRTIDTDKSGAILVKKILEQNHKLIDRKIVKDEKDEIKKILLEWTKKKDVLFKLKILVKCCLQIHLGFGC